MNAFTAEMGTGGALYVYVANAYGNGCSTPWSGGPSYFQQGDIFNTGYCNGFIMPNKVCCKLLIKIINNIDNLFAKNKFF